MSESSHSNGKSRPATIGATGAQVGDVRLGEPAHFRMVLVSFLAGGVGLVAGLVAFILYKLIGLFTNIFFYHRFVTEFVSARQNHLGFLGNSGPRDRWPCRWCDG